MSNTWQKFIAQEAQQEYFQKLEAFIAQEEAEAKILYPPKQRRFYAFELCSFEKTKVVILGQDPYHGENQAMGLAFGVPSTQKKLPPSLKNIYKELHDDIGCALPSNGDLSSWAKEGVLLINAVLSVEQKKPNAHQGMGWEIFTDHVIEKLSEEKEFVVFVLWGTYARSKKRLINLEKHAVIESAHPSPLSAYRGFFGSKPFSHINTLLEAHQLEKIKWCI